MTSEIISRLGPLASLAGIWEGDKGDDTAPSDDRGIEINKYREHIVFEPFGPVNNHEQSLYGLRYSISTKIRLLELSIPPELAKGRLGRGLIGSSFYG